MLKHLKGLKFPDIYVVRFFFKEELFKIPEREKTVVEFGCGNGNNLALFYEYDYKCLGIDISEICLANAVFNFNNFFLSEHGNFSFKKVDLNDINSIVKVLEESRTKFKIFMFPNSLNYLRKKKFANLLEILPQFLQNEGFFFVRFRSPRDSRVFGAEKIGNNEFLIKSNVSGEEGAVLSVYDEHEMVKLLNKYLNIFDIKVFHVYEENLYTDRKLINADIVIWGKYQI